MSELKEGIGTWVSLDVMLVRSLARSTAFTSAASAQSCVCVCVLGSCDMNTVGGDVMETVLAWEHLVYENSTEHIV